MSDHFTASPASVEYRPIPNHPGYRAGADGSIWSCWHRIGGGNGQNGGWTIIPGVWKFLAGYKSKKSGRRVYQLRRISGKYRGVCGSVLVLEAFVGRCPVGMEACHNNGDATDDSIGNLRWDTHQSNIKDKLIHGTCARGSRIGTSVLDENRVLEMRRRRRAGETVKSLAASFSVSNRTVSLICTRKAWTHV